MDIKVFNAVPPAVNQIEVNPFHQQAESVDFMRDNGVQAGSVGAVRRGTQQPVQERHPD